MPEEAVALSPQEPAAAKKSRPKVTVEDDNSGSEREDEPQPTSTKHDDGDDKESGEEEDSSEPIAGSSKDGATPATAAQAQNEWQAVWAPTYNAYYFYNTRTKETTWTNPLLPPTEGQAVTENPPTSSDKDAVTEGPEPSSSRGVKSSTLVPDEAVLNGIDPALAYLDPTLYATRAGGAPPNTFSAKFNARTGRFTAMSDSRDPSYLSEAERAKRMSSVFFDVDKWEADVASRKSKEAEEAAAGAGDKRKRPTKAELERWKEAKKRKKQAKHAWLLS
ncbi:hypothetical protein FS837_002924 [Tulasnella sp. UAMH 9824]|nr:hypothetical protein FS837_002924 [Tulasnella sp. UAMH 9824]